MGAQVPPPSLQGSADDDDLQRKRRIADKLMADFLAIEAELLGTPYIRVEVVSDRGSWEMTSGPRRRFKRAA